MYSCNDPQVNAELFALACGPDYRIKAYSACDVNGVRYRTQTRDARRVTQNCGIWVEGESCDYYGLIEEIFELTYIFDHKVELFKCTWFDTNVRRKNIHTDIIGTTSINVSGRWYENEPYVLARQACQVFYVDDIKMGRNWKVVQKFHHRHVWADTDKLENGTDNDDIVQHGESEAYQESSSQHIDITFDAMDIEQLNREDVEPIEVIVQDEEVNEDTLAHSMSDTESENEPSLNSDEDSDDCDSF